MNEITERRIGETVIKLIQAGKRMPEAQSLFGLDPAQRQAESTRQLKAVIKLWHGLFEDKNIGLLEWERAEKKALTMGNYEGVDTTIISPALMFRALELSQKEHLEKLQQEHAQVKSTSVFDGEIVGDDILHHVNRECMRWTATRMKEYGFSIFKYVPSLDEGKQYCREIGMSEGEIASGQASVAMAYIADQRFAKAKNIPAPSELYFDEKHRLFLKSF